MLVASASGATISTFLGFGTEVLTWFITSFGSVLSFMLANPICFIGLVMSLVVAAIGTLRHVIGG